jgi:hypothetical protein
MKAGPPNNPHRGGLSHLRRRERRNGGRVDLSPRTLVAVVGRCGHIGVVRHPRGSGAHLSQSVSGAPSQTWHADQRQTIAIAAGASEITTASFQVFELGVAADNAQRSAAGKAAWRVERGYCTGGGRPLDGSIPDAASPATAPGHYGDPLTSQAHGHAAVIAILYGSEDSTLAWLRAGEALSAAWLTATELAVSVMPLSATIEIAITREKMRRLLGGLGYPYLVLRLGAIEPVDTTEPDTPRLSRNGSETTGQYL